MEVAKCGIGGKPSSWSPYDSDGKRDDEVRKYLLFLAFYDIETYYSTKSNRFFCKRITKKNRFTILGSRNRPSTNRNASSFLSSNTIARNFWAEMTTITLITASTPRGSRINCERMMFQVCPFEVNTFGTVITRPGDLGVRSGEFCVCKLIASTYIEQIGTIHTHMITKPATSPSSLSYHETLFFFSRGSAIVDARRRGVRSHAVLLVRDVHRLVRLRVFLPPHVVRTIAHQGKLCEQNSSDLRN